MKTLYHLAAAQHEANVDDDYFRRINVEGTRTILDAAVKAKVDRVVHGSTIGVYGMADEGPVHDRTPLFPRPTCAAFRESSAPRHATPFSPASTSVGRAGPCSAIVGKPLPFRAIRGNRGCLAGPGEGQSAAYSKD